MSQTYSTAAIILAAGSSSRMGGGRHKLLLPLEDYPVLTHVIKATLASLAWPIIVVLGHQAEQVRVHLATYAEHADIMTVENPHYLQGMSTSMRAGLEALIVYGYRKFAISSEVILDSVALPHPRDAINRVPTDNISGHVPIDASSHWFDIDSALIMLGDQPLITPRIIDALIRTRSETGKRIVAPLYEGKRGNPTLFAASLFPELLGVTGDEGGRRVVEQHREELELVELGDATANYDVDTWEAYQEVVEAWKGKKRYEGDLHKKQARFWLEYSRQLSTAIRYTEALQATERAVALDEDNAEAWYVQGTCQAMLAQYHEALQAFERALTLNTAYVPAWDGKAWVLGILGDKQGALEAVNRALELDPEYFDAVRRKKRLEVL